MAKLGTSAEMQHWAPGYPNSGSTDESCASMWVDMDGEHQTKKVLEHQLYNSIKTDNTSGFWHDISCTEEVRAICEKPVPATTTAATTTAATTTTTVPPTVS